MPKTLCTKLALVSTFLEKAKARDIRGKTNPLCAWVIEDVHPAATSNWDLRIAEVEAHQYGDMKKLVQEMQAEFACGDIEPAQFI